MPINIPRRTLFGLTSRSKPGDGSKDHQDELEEYKGVFSSGAHGGNEVLDSEELEKERVRAMREMSSIEQISALDQRWISSWLQPILAG